MKATHSVVKTRVKLSQWSAFIGVDGKCLRVRQRIAVFAPSSSACYFIWGSDILPGAWDVTVVVRGQISRLAQQGQQAYSRQSLTDNLILSSSNLLNFWIMKARGVWSLGYGAAHLVHYLQTKKNYTLAQNLCSCFYPLMWAVHSPLEQTVITDKTLRHSIS